MTESDHVRAHVFVSGRVQGVFFRASTREAAREEGVDGWVKNLSDGRVEAVFEGDHDSVERLIDWCKTGSRAANVGDVELTMEQPEGEDGFEIHR